MPQWIQYELSVPTTVCRISFQPRHGLRDQSDCPLRYKFQGSQNGTENSWKDLLVVLDQTCHNDDKITRVIKNCSAFTYYRLKIMMTPGRWWDGKKIAFIRDLQFFKDYNQTHLLPGEKKSWLNLSCRKNFVHIFIFDQNWIPKCCLYRHNVCWYFMIFYHMI